MRVQVARATDAAGHDAVEFAVADTGPGIPADELPWIFERFYRGDRAQAGATGGSGLGLAIVKRIAELHAADLGVDSQPGLGSRFAVRFAAADAARAAAPDAARPQDAPAPGRAPHR